MTKNKLTNISILDNEQIRKVLIDNEWWFSIVDIIGFFTNNENPSDYWDTIKSTASIELSKICKQLKLIAPDGEQRETDCANTEGIFRIIQSIPSPKAEPFKLWLAKVAKERLDEIENPELGIERAKSLYEKKGYPKAWIERRVRGIGVRQKLTDEWQERGAKTDDYAILTNEIMQGAFGLKVDEHKKLKGLKTHNLRDHMTDLELIITMLGEATTTQLTQERDSNGVPKLRRDAKDGGAVAGRTRKDIERQIGTKVVSKENFLPVKKSPKKIESSQ